MLDVICAVPATGKFEYLKENIIKRFSDSVEERLNKLLATVSTEGRKPSQLLHHMQRLAGDRATEDLLKIKWLNLLPSSAHSLLSVLDGASLDKLAESADKSITLAARRHQLEATPLARSHQVGLTRHVSQPSRIQRCDKRAGE